MNRHRGKLAITLLFVAMFFVVAILGASGVQAKGKGGLAKQIQGSWVLVSIYNEKDGKKADVFGPNPKGYMVYAPDGHFSFIMMSPGLPKFASNDRAKGTVEENQAIVQGSIATFGTYKVASEKDHRVSWHIKASTFPNWDGQDQHRDITVTGGEMKVINPFASIGGTNYQVWKRVK